MKPPKVVSYDGNRPPLESVMSTRHSEEAQRTVVAVCSAGHRAAATDKKYSFMDITTDADVTGSRWGVPTTDCMQDVSVQGGLDAA